MNELPKQINYSLFHNNDGFNEEIKQLKVSLKEYRNERQFLKNDINRLQNELKNGHHG